MKYKNKNTKNKKKQFLIKLEPAEKCIEIIPGKNERIPIHNLCDVCVCFFIKHENSIFWHLVELSPFFEHVVVVLVFFCRDSEVEGPSGHVYTADSDINSNSVPDSISNFLWRRQDKVCYNGHELLWTTTLEGETAVPWKRREKCEMTALPAKKKTYTGCFGFSFLKRILCRKTYCQICIFLSFRNI